MQYRLNKSQLGGIKHGGHVSERSILQLFETPQAPYRLEDDRMNVILREPDYIAQLTLVNNHTFFDLKLSYQGHEHVSLIQENDGYLVESPTDLETILTGVQMYMGNSVFMTSDLEVTLSLEDANLFALILDYIRHQRNVIKGMTTTFTEADMKGIISISDHENSVSAYMKMVTETSGIGDMNNLMDAQLIESKGGSYQLKGEALNLAHAFTTLDNYVRVDVAANVSAGFTTLQSGLYTVLYLEKKGLEVQIRTLSPGILMEMIEEMLAKNEKLMAMVPASVNAEKTGTSQSGVTSKKFCTHCGYKLETNSKFCGQCGAKL